MRFLVCLSALTVAVTAPAAAQTAAPLAFMAGCWQGAIRGGFIEERYTPPATNLLLGTTRYVRDGRAVDFEFTLIAIGDSGTVVTPYPKGRASVAFREKERSATHVVWENLAHDFPNRIIYRRLGTDSLLARIEGADGRGQEWRMGPCR